MRIQPLHAPQPPPGKVVDGTENTTKDTSYELIRTVDDWLVATNPEQRNVKQ
jgi:hypothetical protein